MRHRAFEDWMRAAGVAAVLLLVTVLAMGVVALGREVFASEPGKPEREYTECLDRGGSYTKGTQGEFTCDLRGGGEVE